MAEFINEKDSLNEGRKKLNKAIEHANDAKSISEQADIKATEALNKSESTQEQLNQVVIDGDSSVEAAQARVDEKGQTHATLKDRIDDGFIKVNSQLADIDEQKASKDEVDTKVSAAKVIARNSAVTKDRIPENEIPASKLSTASQEDRIKLVNLHEEVIQTMAGETPVNSIPGEGSVTIETFAPEIRDLFLDRNTDLVEILNMTNSDVAENTIYYFPFDASRYKDFDFAIYNSFRDDNNSEVEVLLGFYYGEEGGNVNRLPLKDGTTAQFRAENHSSVPVANYSVTFGGGIRLSHCLLQLKNTDSEPLSNSPWKDYKINHPMFGFSTYIGFSTTKKPTKGSLAIYLQGVKN